jgi:ribose 5-phosphate isomerase B
MSGTRRAIVGSDHAGVELRQALAARLAEAGFDVKDAGPPPGQSVDYPDLAGVVAAAVGGGEAELGLLVCGTGIGMSIAANKVSGVRAALVHDPFTARMASEHNDANVVCFGARVTGSDLAMAALDAFLASSPSDAERHQRRREKIGALEGI